MKTPMRKAGNFIRSNQRVLAVSLVLASLYSCKKDVQTPENIQNEDSGRVSARAIGNIIYKENADGSSLWSGFDGSIQYSTSYGITASTTQFFNGTKSVRFELRDGDPQNHGGTRSEISFAYPTGLNYWYSYALFFPSAQYKYDSYDEVISQWHQGGGKTPALALRVKADRIYLRTVDEVWHDLGAIDKDKWHTYVFHVKHSSGSDGLIELWRDGQKIMNRSGANMYPVGSTYHIPNWKLGIYKATWNDSRTTNTTQRVLYFDDIKYGDANATYNDMVPVGNGGTSTTTPTTPTSGQSVTSFTLVNSATEKDVLTITDGQTISLSALGLTKANIRANTNPSTLGSVKFELSGAQSKTYVDNKAPYALHGDDGSGNYYYGNWFPPAAGTYTLKATPYTEDNVAGSAGTAKTITFTIKN